MVFPIYWEKFRFLDFSSPNIKENSDCFAPLAMTLRRLHEESDCPGNLRFYSFRRLNLKLDTLIFIVTIPLIALFYYIKTKRDCIGL